MICAVVVGETNHGWAKMVCLDRASRWLAEAGRIKRLRAEQCASGQPTMMCGACRGDTRYDPEATDQSFPYECCGQALTVRRLGDGSFLQSLGYPRLGGPAP